MYEELTSCLIAITHIVASSHIQIRLMIAAACGFCANHLRLVFAANAMDYLYSVCRRSDSKFSASLNTMIIPYARGAQHISWQQWHHSK